LSSIYEIERFDGKIHMIVSVGYIIYKSDAGGRQKPHSFQITDAGRKGSTLAPVQQQKIL